MTFCVAALVSWIVARIFARPIDDILQRIIPDAINRAWVKYLNFAIYVVGISSGVRVWELERYISPQGQYAPKLELNRDRWVLEVYRTIIESLQGIAWLLLVFFVISLIAFVIARR
ncbi:MAG: hypothetical protein ABSD98_17505, partial [Candidatus Korobacteraceae bacterium]